MKEFFEFNLFHFKSFSISVGSILFSILIILANIILIKLMATIVRKRFTKHGNLDGRHYSVIQLLKYFSWTMAILICLNILSIDITFLVAGSAALLVGLGLGMQGIFNDFVSGIVLLIEGTVKVNDIIDLNGQILKVKEISLRTSEVITREDNIVIIPNHQFIEGNVTNWTHNEAPTRFLIDVGVDYSSDTRLVETCLLEAALNHPDIVQADSYKAFVRFNNFGASALEFQLIFWSYNLFRIENTKSKVRYDIAQLFKQHNISIPFNQLVIHQAKE